MIVYVTLFLVIFYVTFNIAKTAFRNHKAHQFFRIKSPNLPVLPNPGLFSGNLFQTIFHPKNWKLIDDYHKKYGTTFGYYVCDQPWVSTKDIELLKLIEVDQGHRHINRAKFNIPIEEFEESIFQVDGGDWRRIRRAISPALTNLRVRSEEVTRDIDLVLRQFHASIEVKLTRAQPETGPASLVFDAKDAFQRYALAVIFLLTYKREGEINFMANKDEWIETIAEGAKLMTHPVIYTSMIFPFMRPICRSLVGLHRIGSVRTRITDYIIEATDLNRGAKEWHRMYQKKLSTETGARERDFRDLKRRGRFVRRLVDTIVDSYIDKKIDYDEFIASTFFLLLAGFETTADTITCLAWQLAMHPEIQEKMRKAILDEGIDSTYVVWCIMETIRWHPAVPLGTGRIVAEDVYTANGCKIPKGTFVQSSTWSLHHDDSIWPEADKFKPERWAKSADFHPAAFMGFGLGPRNCAGGKLAIHEIKLVMRLLLSNYRIERSEETADKYTFSSPGLLYTVLDEPIKLRLVALGNSEKTNSMSNK